MKAANIARRKIPTTYDGLLKLFMLRPIHDRVELENATGVIDLLAGHSLNCEQEDYLDVLSTLIEEYEKEFHPLPTSKMNGLAVLRGLLEENGLNATDLSRLLGVHRTLGQKIVSGDRALTISHIKALCLRFSVSADLLLR